MLILGQDPYHGPGQANGLAFSVAEGEPIPPSLQNIHKELESDLGLARPAHGLLEPWAHQGVLLLNTTLTVRARSAGSHQKHGWETFTDQHSGRQRKGRGRRVRALGSERSKEEGAHQHRSPRRDRVTAPVTVVGAPRLLWEQTLLANQRRVARC